MSVWSQEEAVSLCCEMEQFLPSLGAHVALTGGTLYGSGLRKDCDLVIYRIRQFKEIDVPGLLLEMERRGWSAHVCRGNFVIKLTQRSRVGTYSVDMLFPEGHGMHSVFSGDARMDEYGQERPTEEDKGEGSPAPSAYDEDHA